MVIRVIVTSDYLHDGNKPKGNFPLLRVTDLDIGGNEGMTIDVMAVNHYSVLIIETFSFYPHCHW